MEPQGYINLGLTPRTFPHDKKESPHDVRDLDSVALWKLCAEGPDNAAAWQEFAARFLGQIALFVHRASQSQAVQHSGRVSERVAARGPDQEDLVQEVLMRLVANDGRLLKQFDGKTEGAVHCYLYVIANSVVIDHYRHARRQRRLHPSCFKRGDGAWLERIGLNRDDLKMEQSILVQEIVQILEDLVRGEIEEAEVRERNLLIFKLYLLEGLSSSQIARHCGINLTRQGVDKVITTIMGRLRARLMAPRGNREKMERQPRSGGPIEFHLWRAPFWTVCKTRGRMRADAWERNSTSC